MKNKKIILVYLLIFSFIIIFSLKIDSLYKNKVRVYKSNIDLYSKLYNQNNKVMDNVRKKEKVIKENDKKIEKLDIKKKSLEESLEKKKITNSKKRIYLTFDDGPSTYTKDILNILKKHNIKATFFVTCSNNLNLYLKEYVAGGHTIGLHSCTHKYSQIYSSKDAFYNDINSLNNIIETNIGYRSKYIRFPGGSSNTVSNFNNGIMSELTKDIKNKGYEYYDWNIDSNDAGGSGSNQIYSNVIGALENNRNASIILMHDTKLATKNILDKIITDALKKGYVFDSINENTPVVHHYVNN